MAHGGMPDTSIYTISKATLDAVTKVSANQLKDAQIRHVLVIQLGHTGALGRPLSRPLCLAWSVTES